MSKKLKVQQNKVTLKIIDLEFNCNRNQSDKIKFPFAKLLTMQGKRAYPFRTTTLSISKVSPLHVVVKEHSNERFDWNAECFDLIPFGIYILTLKVQNFSVTHPT